MFSYINGKLIFNSVVSHFLFAPLQTVATCLQLSVKQHKHVHQTKEAKSQELAKLNTQLTIHEKRKMELMIHAGGNQPYVAPVYSSYMETIKGLLAQGWKSFYKGTLFRQIHQIAHLFPYYFLNLKISKQLFYYIMILIFSNLFLPNQSTYQI